MGVAHMEHGSTDAVGRCLRDRTPEPSSRFNVALDWWSRRKLAAQAIPLVGALGGATVNYAFIQHFQEVARGHFTVRRLERAYGKEAVRKAYERFAQDS